MSLTVDERAKLDDDYLDSFDLSVKISHEDNKVVALVDIGFARNIIFKERRVQLFRLLPIFWGWVNRSFSEINCSMVLLDSRTIRLEFDEFGHAMLVKMRFR